VFLTYTLPRTPSAPRLALWRKLRRLGVAQLADGLVALPADARTLEQLEWAADDVVATGGTSGVWLARPATRAQERELAHAMSAARAGEYQAIVAEAKASAAATLSERTRLLRRLRAQARRVHRPDHFPPPEREEARQALARLARDLGEEQAPVLADGTTR
jgi:hypothetical protein